MSPTDATQQSGPDHRNLAILRLVCGPSANCVHCWRVRARLWSGGTRSTNFRTAGDFSNYRLIVNIFCAIKTIHHILSYHPPLNAFYNMSDDERGPPRAATHGSDDDDAPEDVSFSRALSSVKQERRAIAESLASRKRRRPTKAGAGGKADAAADQDDADGDADAHTHTPSQTKAQTKEGKQGLAKVAPPPVKEDVLAELSRLLKEDEAAEAAETRKKRRATKVAAGSSTGANRSRGGADGLDDGEVAEGAKPRKAPKMVIKDGFGVAVLPAAGSSKRLVFAEDEDHSASASRADDWKIAHLYGDRLKRTNRTGKPARGAVAVAVADFARAATAGGERRRPLGARTRVRK